MQLVKKELPKRSRIRMVTNSEREENKRKLLYLRDLGHTEIKVDGSWGPYLLKLWDNAIKLPSRYSNKSVVTAVPVGGNPYAVGLGLVAGALSIPLVREAAGNVVEGIGNSVINGAKTAGAIIGTGAATAYDWARGAWRNMTDRPAVSGGTHGVPAINTPGGLVIYDEGYAQELEAEDLPDNVITDGKFKGRRTSDLTDEEYTEWVTEYIENATTHSNPEPSEDDNREEQKPKEKKNIKELILENVLQKVELAKQAAEKTVNNTKKPFKFIKNNKLKTTGIAVGTYGLTSYPAREHVLKPVVWGLYNFWNEGKLSTYNLHPETSSKKEDTSKTTTLNQTNSNDTVVAEPITYDNTWSFTR